MRGPNFRGEEKTRRGKTYLMAHVGIYGSCLQAIAPDSPLHQSIHQCGDQTFENTSTPSRYVAQQADINPSPYKSPPDRGESSPANLGIKPNSRPGMKAHVHLCLQNPGRAYQRKSHEVARHSISEKHVLAADPR